MLARTAVALPEWKAGHGYPLDTRRILRTTQHSDMPRMTPAFLWQALWAFSVC